MIDLTTVNGPTLALVLIVGAIVVWMAGNEADASSGWKRNKRGKMRMKHPVRWTFNVVLWSSLLAMVIWYAMTMEG